MVPERTRSRRALLAATGGVVGGLAGCLGGGEQKPTDDGPTTSTDRPTPTETSDGPGSGASGGPCPGAAIRPEVSVETPLVLAKTVEAAPGDCPGIRRPQFQRLCATDSPPKFCENLESPTTRIVCSSAIGPDEPLALYPGTDQLELSGRLAILLVNETNATFNTNAYDWQLWKREAGGWYHVEPAITVSPLTPIEPGSAFGYCLDLSNESPAGRRLTGIDTAGDLESTGDEHDVWHYSIPALGGGEYAFGLFGEFEAGADVDFEGETGLVARFELRGSPIEVSRTGLVTDLTVEGDVARGRWTHDLDAGQAPGARFTLERVSADRAAFRTIAEHLVRWRTDRPLRDAIAIAGGNGISEVRLDMRWDESAGFRSLPFPIEYDGEVYETSIRRL